MQSLLQRRKPTVHWDNAMTSQREFRVFCPPSANITKFTGTSQCAWHSPFTFIGLEAAESICSTVLMESQQILDEIRNSNCFSLSLQQQGFTFDIHLRPDGRMEVDELTHSARRWVAGVVFQLDPGFSAVVLWHQHRRSFERSMGKDCTGETQGTSSR